LKEIEGKTREFEEMKKIMKKNDDNSQIKLQNYMSLEKKYTSIKNEYSLLMKKNENLTEKIDSQHIVINELKKVFSLIFRKIAIFFSF